MSKQKTYSLYQTEIIRTRMPDGSWLSQIRMKDWDDNIDIVYSVRTPAAIIMASQLTIRGLEFTEGESIPVGILV